MKLLKKIAQWYYDMVIVITFGLGIIIGYGLMGWWGLIPLVLFIGAGVLLSRPGSTVHK